MTRTEASRAVASLAALLAVLVCTACASRTAGPAEFTGRPELASCGEVLLSQGDTIPDASRDCIIAAATGSGAELKVTSPTTEGDPTVTYYRVGPAIDGVELFIDGTADSYGNLGWRHRYCSGPNTVASFDTC